MTASRPRALAAFLLAVVATHAAYQLGRALLHPKQGLDLAPSWVAARLLLEGDRRVYDDAVVGAAAARLHLHGPAGPGDPVLNFIYPPWVPVAYVPVALLPWSAARVVWFLLSTAAVALGLRLAAEAVARDADEARFYGAGLLVAASFFFPLYYGLMTGQSNAFLFLALTASLKSLARGRSLAAGLFLAPAALVKPFLAFPALVFVFRRDARALLGLAAGGAALAGLGLLAGGPSAWALWGRQIASHNALTAYEPRNHSLAAAALALFAPGGSGTPVVAAPGLVEPFALALGLLASALALAPLLPRGLAGPDAGLAFGATLALALLVTPKSWEHYGLFLLPGFLAAFAAFARSGDEGRQAPLALLGASFAVWAFVFGPKEEYIALRGVLAVFLPLKTCATLLLLSLLAVAARRRS
ncbi:MAG TPA: glycosyltransferase family 87 protein [Thermoanaerobaculia bacterium]|nr:glycosyltransferase family 87 protein [Thermoanaerobaculia bacterium]